MKKRVLLNTSILWFYLYFNAGCATFQYEEISCPDNAEEVEKATQKIKNKVDIFGKLLASLFLPEYFLYTVKDRITGTEYYILGTEPPAKKETETIDEEKTTRIRLKSIVVCNEIKKDGIFSLD